MVGSNARPTSRVGCGAARTALALALALALAALLTGCAGATGTARITATATSTTTAAATATTAPTSTPTTPASAAPCQAPQLAAAIARSSATSGEVSTWVSLQNSSRQACSLDGYPGVQMLDASGHTLPTHVTDATDAYVFTNLQPSRLVLSPGASAHFILQWSNLSPSDGQPCSNAPTSSSLRITPPGLSDALTLAVQLTPCAGNLISSPLVATA